MEKQFSVDSEGGMFSGDNAPDKASWLASLSLASMTDFTRQKLSLFFGQLSSKRSSIPTRDMYRSIFPVDFRRRQRFGMLHDESEAGPARVQSLNHCPAEQRDQSRSTKGESGSGVEQEKSWRRFDWQWERKEKKKNANN